ncbi:hypothetical protein G1C96_0827 [Bifidobacterium sp. DSM 109958]|uniref:Uncharacterized protein n=1 Tax=Bifidobacterium moraviense TaxID=2675323 RepID=A0A7Y0HYZ1_9BIFI|nr:hypothetical protein [Bifidobacterium sp. DSM 109958]NMN00249.1 hypothetical protein [Bifidobacterium sp. DSM 109958]
MQENDIHHHAGIVMGAIIGTGAGADADAERGFDSYAYAQYGIEL